MNDIILFLYSVITIGFNPASYTVAESAGSVNVTVNILNGTLARDVHVLLMTTNGTATGVYSSCKLTFHCKIFVNVMFMESHFSHMQLQWTMWSQVVTWHLTPPHHLKL